MHVVLVRPFFGSCCGTVKDNRATRGGSYKKKVLFIFTSFTQYHYYYYCCNSSGGDLLDGGGGLRSQDDLELEIVILILGRSSSFVTLPLKISCLDCEVGELVNVPNNGQE